MSNIGYIEFLILGILCIFNVGLPIAILVFVFLIHERLRRIEQMLNHKN